MADTASIRLMDVLDEDRRVALQALGGEVRFAPEQTIFWEGQTSHSALIVLDGYVKVTQQAADGTAVLLALRGPNEVIGDEGVLMDEPRSATVTTVTDVTGLDLKGDDLKRFVHRHNLWPMMYQAAVRRRRQADQKILLARLDVKSRLARWLLELASDVGESTEDGWVIDVTLSQNDLASRIGASRDAVAIELRKFREQKLVTTGRRKIILRNIEDLRRIAST